MEHGPQISIRIRPIVERAGWTPDRCVEYKTSVPNEFVLFPAAESILSGFFGLTLGESAAGIECAKSQLIFDPSLALGTSETFKKAESSINSKLFPLAEVDDGHAFLLIDEHGKVYLWFGQIRLVASTFSVALEKLLLGLNYEK